MHQPIGARLAIVGYDHALRGTERERSHREALDAKTEAVQAKDDLEKAYGRLQQNERKIMELMLTDPLTEVANRRCLDQRLEHEMQRVQRFSGNLAVIMTDIDYFKRINDNYGHATGDRVLQAYAAIMRKTIRTTDFVARFGGEEFVLLLPETLEEGATALAERIRVALASEHFDGMDGAVTASFGITTARSSDSAHDVLLRADKALYRSKEDGRNRVSFAA